MDYAVGFCQRIYIYNKRANTKWHSGYGKDLYFCNIIYPIECFIFITYLSVLTLRKLAVFLGDIT